MTKTCLKRNFEAGSFFAPDIKADKTLLGVTQGPAILYGKLQLKCTKPGVAKLKVKATGCGSSSDDKTPALYEKLAGDWQLVSWNGAVPHDFEANVSFTAARTFTIYQRIESVKFQQFTGSYRVDKTLLSGVYSDNQPWGSQYEVALDANAQKLTLTSLTNIQEVSVYAKTTLPDRVKQATQQKLSTHTEPQKRLL